MTAKVITAKVTVSVFKVPGVMGEEVKGVLVGNYAWGVGLPLEVMSCFFNQFEHGPCPRT